MQTPITAIHGVGTKITKLLEKLGVYTTDDLLHLYPRKYEVYKNPTFIAELIPGEVGTTGFFITNPVYEQKTKNNLSISNTTLDDGTGQIKLLWFQMPYLKRLLQQKKYVIFQGKVTQTEYGLQMEQPRYFSEDEYAELQKHIQPVYPQTKGLSSDTIHKLVDTLINQLDAETMEFLPEELLRKFTLLPETKALVGIHHPVSWKEYYAAKNRLVFDEFFLFLLSIRKVKNSMVEAENHYVFQKNELSKKLEDSLPYRLTNAQKQALEEIRKDTNSKKTMNRLVQGDVGSGKTILAILSLLEAAEIGYQCALMVPTEVLAKQHYESIVELFEKNQIPFHVELLTGSMTDAEKRRAYQKIASHEADIVVGTHALIQDAVQYDNLALVITDEQHRFGVGQRTLFGKKGNSPHILVMSATPIPRTMAIILYGDMDISVINERPANRLPIKNCVITASERHKAFTFINQEVANGHQVYIICPMVEENEKVEAENVVAYAENLQKHFPNIPIAHLHGRMKAAEKTKIMEEFSKGVTKVLISTTVIEVGVNVPNATVIMIENAERFGLAQLHQLRGRVGRGSAQSYCILIASSEEKAQAARLDVLRQSNDGFFIASEDLRLRGPGDVMGMQQSGMGAFQLADIYADAKLLKAASDAVDEILSKDPELRTYPKLEEKLSVYMEEQTDNLNL